MKKIVGIIAAVTMAASVFAVDLASMIQIDGDLLKYNKDDGLKALMAKDYDPTGDSDYVWKMSASGDKAGAEIWYYTDDGKVAKDAYLKNYKVWFSPIDALKITIGNVGGQSIAQPNFGWWAQSIQNYDYGYQAEFTYDALYAKLALEPGASSYWFDNSQKGLAKIGGFWAEVKYNFGSYGTVQAIATRNGTIGAHGFSNWNKTPWAFGIAYTNMPYGSTGYYADVVASFTSKQVNKTDDHKEIVLQGVDSQFGGQWMYNGIGLRLTNLVQYRLENGYNIGKGNKETGIALGKGYLSYGFEFKGSYAFDAVAPYIQIDGYNITQKELKEDKCNMEVRVGADFSIGAATMWAALSLPIRFDEPYKFNFSVPCQITLNL